MIHYLSEGSGNTTLVLLHGFCENNTCLKRQVLFFKDHCKVIVPDLPGFGKSDVIGESTMESMADEVYEVLLHENVSECIMIGHSMGGYVTLAFAEKYSRLLKGFGLLHSTANPDTDERLEKRKQVISFIETNGLHPYLQNFIPTLFSKTAHKVEVDFIISEAMKGPKEGIIEAIRAMMKRPDRKGVLKEVSVPVLFVAGEYDQLVPSSDLFLQASMCKVSHIVYLNNAAHMGMIEDPENLNKELQKFIDLCA
jgi:pimeloyl-ACP methyl ester carboxylesterase